MNYHLLATKAIDGTPVRPMAPNPAMLQRPNQVDLDPGRGWAGDLYDTGAPTDPEEAYARFTGEPIDGEDVEAWVDKAPDGTLTGWVRQGLQVWRYTDPAAWALDVDGADMTLTGGEPPAADDDPDVALTLESAGVDPADLDQAPVAEADLAAGDEMALDLLFDRTTEPQDPAEDDEDDEDEAKKPKVETKTIRLVVGRPKG